MGRSSGEGGISQTLQVCGSCELLDLTLGQHKRRFCFPQKTSKQVIKKKKKRQTFPLFGSSSCLLKGWEEGDAG